ncbi:acetylornithine aminotransferase apoenzyme [Desulfonispora thiosulfatigenes DSM 11270]|uniref:Acetylornithine aminotransferase n=1 Tax=Desulfonispora thiosulfatigenes DSM 11270 TaxID=656914 RepID=A0A1W1URA2_DESTI|nr:acetylornithine aminotransferase apoenzyme [Desulfonispora thiosulfatigenes DSM 11270]
MENLVEMGKEYIFNNYGRIPKVIVKGEGSYVWDSEGKKYLDFVAGIAVNNLGHCPKELVEAIKEQAEKLLHCSNLYWIEPQIKLAKKLVENSIFDKVFFCNSGAEANEAAIKLARKWGNGRYEIITMEKSFHGRTLATLGATGQEKFHKDFLPKVDGFLHVPFGDVEKLKNTIGPKTCAVLLEVIQGEGGVNVPNEEYLKEVEKICKDNNLLFIIDEVQTGMGRTGKRFAYENFDLNPDIISLAKGLGGGLPIGAILAKDEIANVFKPGDHGSTFGGNPLVTSGSLAICEKIFDDKFMQEVVDKGEYFRGKLNSLKEKYACIKKVKGLGLMIGCDIDINAQDIVNLCFEKGLIINGIAGQTLRFVPPLTATIKEIDLAIEILDEAFGEV